MWHLLVRVIIATTGPNFINLLYHIGLHWKLFGFFILMKFFVQIKEDDELLTLILKRHLVPNVIATSVYPKIIDYLLANQSTNKDETPYHLQIETIVNQLQHAGYQSEGGSLLMLYKSTHRSLRTFDAAFSVLTRLFKK